MRGRRSAERPDGVGRHVRAHGCGLRACEAYGRAVVEEIRGATEGERIVSGLFPEDFGDFGDFGVSFVATVAGRYTRRGGPRLSVQGEPLIVLTRGP